MRANALRRMIDATPAESTALASEAGFNLALPLFTPERRRDVVDTAIAALGRERAIHVRTLFQAGMGALLVTCFATANSPTTHLMAFVTTLAALPTWVLALGAPDAFASIILSAPVVGKPARDRRALRRRAPPRSRDRPRPLPRRDRLHEGRSP